MSLFSGVMSDPKARSYIYVWIALAVLTVLEVGWVYVPVSHLVVAIGLTAFACVKAAIVGYYYMHLNHETKWLRIVAISPLLMVFYAGVLMAEGTGYSRKEVNYLPENPRVTSDAHPKEAAPQAEAPNKATH